MPPPILALKDVRLADGALPLFDGVDLGLEPSVRACLVGRNGAGKSTLLRILAGTVQSDSGERFITPGTRVAYVPQEPEIVGDTLLDYATAGGALPHEAEAALQNFGLDPARSAQGLSGGETRRAALSRALAEGPEVLLLDEPTNHLDIFAIQTLEEALSAGRFSALIVSHDRAFLNRVTRRCYWLESRKVHKLDNGFAAFDEWADQLAAAEADDARRLDKALKREEHWLSRGVTGRRARNEGRRRRLMDLRQQKVDLLKESRGELIMAAALSGVSGQRVVEAKHLTKAFGERTIVNNFSTRILRGDRLAIVGPNGAGKTTLVKLLLGELKADSGSVQLGTNLQIAYIDQSRAQLDPTATLWEALAPHGGDQIMVRGLPRHIAGYAKDFLFRDAQLRQPVASLSGGERGRLMLAKALASPANLLVLDEPTNDLDMDTLDLLEDMLADFEGALILVSHDRDFIDRLSTSTIGLDGKGGVAEAPGGWTDFLGQNPGFFAGRQGQSVRKAAREAAREEAASGKRQTKLTYKDQRRLEELEGLTVSLPKDIARLETSLADPALYTRDPASFQKTSAALDAARAKLAASEEEWLALEEKREALG